MPVKHRRSKRRPGEDAEAWEWMFEVGTDYPNDLGFSTHEEARAAAPDAWRRFGASFLANRPAQFARDVPWALREFGEP
jgi:hypothetical protein